MCTEIGLCTAVASKTKELKKVSVVCVCVCVLCGVLCGVCVGVQQHSYE